jgi:hypothetical protein
VVYVLFVLFYFLIFVLFLASSSLAKSNNVLEDVFCFVRMLCVLFCLLVYMIFFVCVSNNGQHIRVLYTRVPFVSGSTLHMKIYFDLF